MCVTFEPADCWGAWDAVGEADAGIADAEFEVAVEVELEAEEVKGRLGMEARLANEGL